MPNGPLHHHKPGTEAGRRTCSEQRSVFLVHHASFAGEVQRNVSAFCGQSSLYFEVRILPAQRRETPSGLIGSNPIPATVLICKAFSFGEKVPSLLACEIARNPRQVATQLDRKPPVDGRKRDRLDEAADQLESLSSGLGLAKQSL